MTSERWRGDHIHYSKWPTECAGALYTRVTIENSNSGSDLFQLSGLLEITEVKNEILFWTG